MRAWNGGYSKAHITTYHKPYLVKWSTKEGGSKMSKKTVTWFMDDPLAIYIFEQKNQGLDILCKIFANLSFVYNCKKMREMISNVSFAYK